MSTATLTTEALDWLRQYFIDTYNDDWCSPHQLDLIGAVPDEVLAWAETERCVICASCGDVSNGQYCVTTTDDDGTQYIYCEDCYQP